MAIIIFLLLAAVVVLSLGGASKRRKRKDAFASRLTDVQRAIVAKQVPLTKQLPFELHGSLEGKINGFLQQVEFHGCDGLDVTEDMKLSIAAQACLLVVNSDQWYKNLSTILIYPSAFKSLRTERSGFIVSEKETIRLGESWSRGPVILSWAHSQHGATNYKDGHNVVFHEFAHQLDDLSGHTDGAPVLANDQRFREWETVILRAYDLHVKKVEKAQKTVIDAYGAQGHEEFFAVCVELFFEKPNALRNDEPEVYDQLKTLFQLDPVAWSAAHDEDD